MNRQAKTFLGAVVAGMLAVPASYAAIDDAGMQYTSAAEGFYGSLRMELSSSDTETVGGSDSDTSKLDAFSSRLGVRGTVDLGGGLSANYRYEFGVNADNGASVGTTRLHTVGLDGGFGSLLVGTQWALDYNYVWGRTDVMNNRSGYFAYSDDRAGRQSSALTYTSPDFNGFSFGFSGIMSAEGKEVNRAVKIATYDVATETYTGTATDVVVPDATYAGDGSISNAAAREGPMRAIAQADDASVTASGEEAAVLDKFVAAAQYSIRGFDIAGAYVRRDLTEVNAEFGWDATNRPGEVGLLSTTEVETNPVIYGVGLGYGQDNWSLGYYYSKSDQDDIASTEQTVHSLAGQLQVGKTTLRALYETGATENNSQIAYTDAGGNALMRPSHDLEQDVYTLSVQYDLGSKSRIWLEYNVDETTDPDNISGGDDVTSSDTSAFGIGYRVDF